MDKLFIVTSATLAPGAIAAQSVHAALAFAHEHSFEWRSWYLESNNIVLLSAENEEALLRLAARARAAGVPCSVFREPDFENAVTAIAISPAGRKLVSSLPLALREKKAA